MSSLTPATNHATSGTGHAPAPNPLEDLSAQERLIIEIFELDPRGFSAEIWNQPSVGDGQGGATSPAPKVEERLATAEPKSPERDFWEQVAQYEKQLACSGGEVVHDRVYAAIALAAGELSSKSAAMTQGPQTFGTGAVGTPLSAAQAEGSVSLVERHDQLTGRANQALAFAQTLTGAALHAASPARS